MQVTDLPSFAQGVWYISIAFAVLLGFGFGSIFWWLVLKD